ncbi:tetratricopeptide repeat protein, partial [Acidomonas methanolica]
MSLKLRVASHFSREARLAYGVSLLEGGENAARGFRLLSALATEGVTEAQYQVGRAYLDGTGVPASLPDGAHWMMRAARDGHVKARFSIAILHVLGLPEGIESGAAASPLAVGPGIRKPDFAEGARWARLAAEAGSPDAQALLGYILTN